MMPSRFILVLGTGLFIIWFVSIATLLYISGPSYFTIVSSFLIGFCLCGNLHAYFGLRRNEIKDRTVRFNE